MFQEKRFKANFLIHCALIYFMGVHKIQSFDYWTHLRIGQELSSLPLFSSAFFSSVFQFTEFGLSSFVFSWGLYGLQSLGGDVLVSLTVAALAAFPYAIYLWFSSRKLSLRNHLLFICVVYVTVLILDFRVAPRPETLAYVMMTLLLSLVLWLNFFSSSSFWRIATIGFGIIIMWAMFHPSWPIGIYFFVLLYIASSHQKPHLRMPATKKSIALLSLVFTPLALGCGAFIWFIVRELQSGGLISTASEMQPLWSFLSILLSVIGLTLICIYLIVFNVERWKRRVVIALLLILPGLFVVRVVGFSLLALLALVLMALSQNEGKASHRAFFNKWAIMVVGVLCLGANMVDKDPIAGTGVRWELFPLKSAGFVAEHHWQGNILNQWGWGGFLRYIWQGEPDVFLDGTLFSKARLHAHDQFMAGGPLEPIIQKYNISLFLSPALYLDSGRLYPVFYRLLFDPRWMLVDASDAVIFARTPLPSEVDRLAPKVFWEHVLWQADVLDKTDGFKPHLQYSRGIASLELANFSEAQKYFSAALKEAPELKKYYAPYLYRSGVPID